MRDEILDADTAEFAGLAGLLGVDTQFQRVVDGVLASLRQALGVAEVNDPLVTAEFARASVRLQAFRDGYLALHARILSNHIAAEQLAGVVAGLSHPGTRLFREAEPQIHRELAQATATLSRRMADTLLFDPPTTESGAQA